VSESIVEFLLVIFLITKDENKRKKQQCVFDDDCYSNDVYKYLQKKGEERPLQLFYRSVL